MNQTPVSSAPAPSGVKRPQGGSGSLKWLLVILGLVIVLGGVYWAYAKYGERISSTISARPTISLSVPANWKKYTNEEFGFSFKYPESWIQETTTASHPTFLFVPQGDLVMAGQEFIITKLDQDIDKEKKEREKLNSQISYQSIIIDGHRAYKSNTRSGIESSGKDVIIEINNGILLIFASGEPLNSLDQILSTFQFTP